MEDLQPLGRSRGRGRGRRSAHTLSYESSEAVGAQNEELLPLGRGWRGRRLNMVAINPKTPIRRPNVSVTDSNYVGALGDVRREVSTCQRDEEPTLPHSSSVRSDSTLDMDRTDLRMSDLHIDSRKALKGCRSVKNDSQKKQLFESMVWTKPKDLVAKKGTTGQVVCLHANYFQLPTVTNWQLYQYRVDFQPEEDRNMAKRELLRGHKELLGGYLFDGTIMFTARKYNTEPLVIFSKRPSDEVIVRITIKLVGVLAFGDNHYLHFFNILMRHCLNNLNLQLVGRHYHDSQARIVIDKHKLELWPGYVTSIRQHEQELLLCTEIIHKVMRQDTVHDFLVECSNHNPRDYQIKFKQAILGSIVLTDYSNKTYRINDVDFSASPVSKFERNGELITYIEYYSQKYDLHIKDRSQPMLISIPKQRDRRQGETSSIYLVPELCRMTGLSDGMRTNFALMRDLSDFTRLSPSQRMERLQHFNRCLKTNSQIASELESWNMEMSETLVSLPGRILPRENIILGSRIKCDAGPTSDWTRALRLQPMLITQEIDSWVVITPNQARQNVTQFVSNLRKAALGMDLRLPEPTYQDLPNDKLGSYVEALDRAMLNYNPKFIFVVLTTNRLDRYSGIKKKCCVDRAVPTQLILLKNINTQNVVSVATKVAIQINCKIGGAPWAVEIPLQGLMAVGFDVSHDTSHRGMSIGALVASLDRSMSRYFSAISYHGTGEELSNYLSVNICKALHKYSQYNHGLLPQRIVIYRDGVGEGQIPYVFEHEVTILREKLQQIYAEKPYQMAFIIVTKRINTRLFYNGGNPPPGTVVDDVITLPNRYDFFLVSQSVRQGTVSPTSYNVIFDNLGLSPDQIQRLTYKLTHLYFNWSGTVRVPAPCQYAHKLAYLVGQAIHVIPNSKLEDLLYFL